MEKNDEYNLKNQFPADSNSVIGRIFIVKSINFHRIWICQNYKKRRNEVLLLFVR